LIARQPVPHGVIADAEVILRKRVETLFKRFKRLGSLEGIQEIKTTYLPLEELTPAHYPAYHAQLDTYGYLCETECFPA